MKVFKIEEFVKMENPNPGAPFRRNILKDEPGAENLGGLFGLLAPGNQGPYHFHEKRESILIAISGEATEIIEGKEITLKANDILYIPAGEKHMTVNRGDNDFRYLEFFTCPPVMADFIEVK